jgi:hypothetical protein
MNREGGEIFLRLLAEAVLRGSLAPAPQPPWAGGPGVLGGGRVRMMAVARALTAVRALDTDTVEDILADFDLAVSVRQLHEQASLGPAGTASPGTGPPGAPPPGTMQAAAVARLAAQLQFGHPAPPIGAGRAARMKLARSADPADPKDPKAPEPSDESPGHGDTDRFVPIGLPFPFHDEGVSGELYLMSYVHTGAGARFTTVWGIRTLSLQHRMGLRHPDLIPFELFTLTDDRGARYDLDFVPGGGPEWTGEISLRPNPPDDIRWLDFGTPLGPAVRVELPPENSAADSAPQVSETKLSPGEHLLVMLAERLLTTAPEFPQGLQQRRGAVTAGPLQAMTTGLGDVIPALEAADVLPPLSPVPARLAALCASMGVSRHGIAVPPARDLPEPWLSLLAHYQRRKPDTAPVRDGYAAVAAALPELDGIRLALLGLHNTEGKSSLHVLARGLMPENSGPFGVDMYFPLSVWLRDSGGRWHAGRPAGWRRTGPEDREYAVRLQLVPPLPRSTAWIEVLAGGRSAEVRTKLPLRWGYPP